MNEAGEGDLALRLNTEGGSPEYGWGMVAKFGEFKGKKLIKVDGKAQSMGLYFLCYSDDNEALDVSQFLLHRAAYSDWIESNPNYMTEAMWDNLNAVNKKLRAAFEAKVDVTKFEQLTGVKLDDVFSNEKRIDVPFNAKVAKQIGLINKIVALTPQKKAEISSAFQILSSTYNDMQIAALGEVAEVINPAPAGNPTPNNQSIKMDLNKLKAEHPAIYAEVIALGVAQEKDRVGAWMAFNQVDPEAVKKGIESGANISQTAMAEFSMKMMSADGLKKIAEGNPPVIKTDEVAADKTAADNAIAVFEAALDKNLNIKKA